MSDVAKTILEQLGGRRFIAMTGARNLVGGQNDLSMSVNGKVDSGRVNRVRIILDPSDTYTVISSFISFRRGEGGTPRYARTSPRYMKSSVYCDQLQEAFTHATGLYTHL